jgi:hypothetical protein
MLYEIQNGSVKHHKVVDQTMSLIIDEFDIPDNVFVEISFVTHGSAGGCVDMEREDGIHTFSVELNSRQSIKELRATLIHEMKHVEQYASGRLDQNQWLGVDHKDTPYDLRPWEIEAYQFEQNIFEKYFA